MKGRLMKQEPSAKSVAMDLLSRRSYSVAQLRRKLDQREFEHDAIESVLTFFLEHGWLNDDLYAQQLTRSRVASGYGPSYIRQYLQGKGIDSDRASHTLALEQWDWWAACERAFWKKYRQVPQEWAAKSKCSAYLFRRGFDSDLIRNLLESLKTQEEEESDS
jgi:regulatory protein